MALSEMKAKPTEQEQSDNREDVLWRALQRAIALDLEERTPETRLIRSLVYQALTIEAV